MREAHAKAFQFHYLLRQTVCNITTILKTKCSGEMFL